MKFPSFEDKTALHAYRPPSSRAAQESNPATRLLCSVGTIVITDKGGYFEVGKTIEVDADER